MTLRLRGQQRRVSDPKSDDHEGGEEKFRLDDTSVVAKKP